MTHRSFGHGTRSMEPRVSSHLWRVERDFGRTPTIGKPVSQSDTKAQPPPWRQPSKFEEKLRNTDPTLKARKRVSVLFWQAPFKTFPKGKVFIAEWSQPKPHTRPWVRWIHLPRCFLGILLGFRGVLTGSVRWQVWRLCCIELRALRENETTSVES